MYTKWEKEQVSKKKLQITNYATQLKRSLNKNTESVEQIANYLDGIKTQQNDLKKNLLSFKSNNQAAIKALEASQQAIGEIQGFINKEFGSCKVKQGTIEERAKAAQTKIINMKAEIYSLQETFREEQSKVNDLEQYGEKSMAEIKNIPFTADENLESVTTDIARQGMKLDHFNYKQYVDVAHILNGKLPIPPIIVMFNSQSMREEFYESRKQLKNIKLKDINPNYKGNNVTFINESLTIKNNVLFRKVTQSCKANNFRIFLTFNGKIMCRKAMNTPTIIIKNEENINQKLSR